MNKETLRMQMLAGVITESEYKAVIIEEIENEDFQKGIDLIKSEMERHINDVSNKEDIGDQEKKRRINNIKFVVYDFLDPNTNGGVRPSNDFQFNEDWWNSISPETDPFQFHDAASNLVRAAKGDSFGKTDIPLNESMIGGIVGIGAINQIPPRAKNDYEMAFEHFLGEKYEIKPNRKRDDIKDINEEDTVEDVKERTEEEVTEEDFPKMDKIEDYDNPRQKFKWKGESIYRDDLINAVENADDYSLVTYFAVSMFDPNGNPNSLQNLLVKKEIDKRGLLKDN